MTREEFTKGIQEALGLNRLEVSNAQICNMTDGNTRVLLEIIPSLKQRQAIAKVVAAAIIRKEE